MTPSPSEQEVQDHTALVVKDLRTLAEHLDGGFDKACVQAADIIEHLSAENAALDAAIERENKALFAAQATITSLQAAVASKDVALDRAAKQFRFYETEHMNAGKLIKAATNGTHAVACEATLTPEIRRER